MCEFTLLFCMAATGGFIGMGISTLIVIPDRLCGYFQLVA